MPAIEEFPAANAIEEFPVIEEFPSEQTATATTPPPSPDEFLAEFRKQTAAQMGGDFLPAIPESPSSPNIMDVTAGGPQLREAGAPQAAWQLRQEIKAGAGQMLEPLYRVSDNLKLSKQQVADAVDTLAGAAAAYGGILSGEKSPEKIFAEVAGQKQRVPTKAEAIVAGADQAITQSLDFFTSPVGIATLGTGALPKVAQRAISLAFVAQMSSQFPEQWKQFNEARQAGDVEGMARGLTGMGLSGAFITAAGIHAASPELKALAPATARAVEEIPQPKEANAEAIRSDTGQLPPQGQNLEGSQAPSEYDLESSLSRQSESLAERTPSKTEGITSLSQVALDFGRGTTEQFANLPARGAGIEKALNNLDVKGQQSVVSGVVAALHNDKVFETVVQSIPVDVMNDLSGGKFSPDRPLDNKAMLLSKLSGIVVDSPVLQPVLRFFDSVFSSPKATKALLGTENVPTSVSERLALFSGKQIPTAGASKSHVQDITSSAAVVKQQAAPPFTPETEKALAKSAPSTPVETPAEIKARATTLTPDELNTARADAETRFRTAMQEGRTDDAARIAAEGQFYREELERRASPKPQLSNELATKTSDHFDPEAKALLSEIARTTNTKFTAGNHELLAAAIPNLDSPLAEVTGKDYTVKVVASGDNASPGILIVEYRGKPGFPVSTGRWMDFWEPWMKKELGLTKSQYESLTEEQRAKIDAQRQLSKYLEGKEKDNQFPEWFARTYHPNEWKDWMDANKSPSKENPSFMASPFWSLKSLRHWRERYLSERPSTPSAQPPSEPVAAADKQAVEAVQAPPPLPEISPTPRTRESVIENARRILPFGENASVTPTADVQSADAMAALGHANIPVSEALKIVSGKIPFPTREAFESGIDSKYWSDASDLIESAWNKVRTIGLTKDQFERAMPQASDFTSGKAYYEAAKRITDKLASAKAGEVAALVKAGEIPKVKVPPTPVPESPRAVQGEGKEWGVALPSRRGSTIEPSTRAEAEAEVARLESQGKKGAYVYEYKNLPETKPLKPKPAADSSSGVNRSKSRADLALRFIASNE